MNYRLEPLVPELTARDSQKIIIRNLEEVTEASKLRKDLILEEKLKMIWEEDKPSVKCKGMEYTQT